jgi:hypothetical protein
VKEVFMSDDPTPAPEPQNPPQDPPKDEGKTFTQADVDRIIAGRLAKFSDYDDLKSKVSEMETANQTDLEKAVKTARHEATAEVTQKTNARLVAAEIRAVASELGYRDPADALAQYGDLTAVSVDDEGQVDTATVKSRLEQIAKDKSYLLKDNPVGSAADAGIGVGGSGPAVDVKPGLGRLQAAYANTTK